MKLFATGKTGYIGRHLPESVKSLPFRLTSDNDYLGGTLNLEGSCVIHLAGVVGNKVDENPSAASLVNVEYAAELAKSLAEQGVNKFIYVSSGHVYGPSAHARTETSIPKPVTEYGRQKLRAEQEIEKALDGKSTSLTIARVFSILDSGMPKGTLGGTLDAAQSAGHGFPIKFTDDIRDFLKVKSVVDALLSLTRSDATEAIYNIASGRPLSVAEAATKYLSQTNISNQAFEVELMKGNSKIPSLWGDSSRISTLIGCKLVGL